MTVCVILGGCTGQESFSAATDASSAMQAGGPNMSVWITYWDTQGVAEQITAMREDLLGVSFFAAYFNESEDLFIPDELLTLKNQIQTDHRYEYWNYYLTFVNDWNTTSGPLLKNTDILRKKFTDKSAMEAHIEQIISLTAANGFDGIEIDYEAFQADMALWGSFNVFCEQLYRAAEAKGLKMRVIFEPGAPIETLTLCEGPEYVMMCYNLFGPGQQTGPKASYAFIESLIEKMAAVPGKKTFALANGGYEWIQGADGVQLTEAEAVERAKSHKAVVYRSPDSGALTFQYRDSAGAARTVWYADAQTLAGWQAVIQDAGHYGVMLWRVEGRQQL